MKAQTTLHIQNSVKGENNYKLTKMLQCVITFFTFS